MRVRGFAVTTTITKRSCKEIRHSAPEFISRPQPWTASDYTQRERIRPCRFSSLDDFLEGSDFDRLLKQEEDVSDDVKESSVSNGWREMPLIDNQLSGKKKLIASIAEIKDDNLGLPPSPVEQHTVKDRTIWIKRDDLLKLPNSGISGNKARKMWVMDRISPKDFPECIVSYGGPQSNSMMALAAIVHSKNRMLDEGSNNDNS